MKRIMMLMLPMIFAVACSAQQNSEDVKPAEAKKMMNDEGVVVLDVRTDDEWNEGHLEGAEHIDFYSEDFDQQLADLPKDKEYVVYCHSGNRSGQAVQKMKKAGFENVHNLEGGISAWKREGNETVK